MRTTIEGLTWSTSLVPALSVAEPMVRGGSLISLPEIIVIIENKGNGHSIMTYICKSFVLVEANGPCPYGKVRLIVRHLSFFLEGRKDHHL